jgi:hypothetical protein
MHCNTVTLLSSRATRYELQHVGSRLCGSKAETQLTTRWKARLNTAPLIPSVQQTDQVLAALNGVTLHLMLRFFAWTWISRRFISENPIIKWVLTNNSVVTEPDMLTASRGSVQTTASIVRMVTSRGIRWAEHVARMEKRILVGKLGGKGTTTNSKTCEVE